MRVATTAAWPLAAGLPGPAGVARGRAGCCYWRRVSTRRRNSGLRRGSPATRGGLGDGAEGDRLTGLDEGAQPGVGAGDRVGAFGLGGVGKCGDAVVAGGGGHGFLQRVVSMLTGWGLPGTERPGVPAPRMAQPPVVVSSLRRR